MHASLEEIKPETAEILAAQAEARGLSVDEYLKSLLGVTNSGHAPAPGPQMTPEERARMFEEWAHSHRSSAPPLSDEAISRESIYTREDEQL
jgi:hypothetical protein